MITGNELAYPFEYEHRFGSEDQFTTKIAEQGLTIRQYFAAMFLQGIATQGVIYYSNGDCHAQKYAKEAVVMADALIEELNKTEKTQQ